MWYNVQGTVLLTWGLQVPIPGGARLVLLVSQALNLIQRISSCINGYELSVSRSG